MLATAPNLPLPFFDDPWRGDEKEAAQALWAWRGALAEARGTLAEFEIAAGRVESGHEPEQLVPEEVAKAALVVCRQYALPLDALAAQVRAAAHLQSAVRFGTRAELHVFVQNWAVAHGRLLARLAGVTLRAQQPLVDELATGFFLTSCLAQLPRDLARDHLFIPLDELEQAGVALDQLRAGVADEPVRRLLWKQDVRARDALAQGQALARDLDGRQRRAFKRAWLGALELLNQIDRRDYDVWSEPVALTPGVRWQIHLHAFTGKAFQ